MDVNDGYVDLILQRMSSIAAQQDRQTEKLNALRDEVASLARLLKRIDERLEKIERRQHQSNPGVSPQSSRGAGL